MATLIDITSNILTENTIRFHASELDSDKVNIPIEDGKFGILNFKAVTSHETNNELDLLFTVDCSGSMSDICSDDRSKMQHIIHTLKNMVLFFNDHPNINVNITVCSFDNLIYETVPRIKVTEETIAEIISKIEKITPRNTTNIELALMNAAEKILEIKTLYPTNIISHIFMTDGETTDGSKNIDRLKSLVNSDIINSFIGFGIDHDACLLNEIASIGKSGYYFIDKLEYAGLVYGEILHGIIYKLLDNVEIQIENGLIYDFKIDEWVRNLQIGNIVSEANKTFNIISDVPEKCRINIKGSLDNLILILPSTKVDDSDLTTHIYRQRTLQLLYKVNKFCIMKRETETFNREHFQRRINDEDNIYRILSRQKKELKLELSNLLEEIKKYMADNDLNEDKILKNLCDDIYISYRTFGTRLGTMFCAARLTSQGAQRQYTAYDTHTLDCDEIEHQPIDHPAILPRHTTTGVIGNNLPRFPLFLRETNIDNFPIIQHEVSDFRDTPYFSNQVTQVMREISRSIDPRDDSSSLV